MKMAWYWWVFLGLSIGVFVLDLVLELTGRRTISEIVEDLPIPNWVWYALSGAGYVVVFLLMGPAIAALCLAFWLFGHFSQV